MTKITWKQFLFVHLPGAALTLTLVAQVLSFGLSGVPMWRTRFDEVALATLKDPTQFRILLLGDSVTMMATGRYSLAAPGEVGNISTSGWTALPAALFQLQRYLSTHPSPEHVVLVYAPGTYHKPEEFRIARYHLWRMYDRPEERDFLRTYFPGIGRRDWLPAILNVRERLVDPVISLLAQWNRLPRMENGTRTPNPDAPVEMAVRAEAIEDEVLLHLRDTTISAAGAEALSGICYLGKKYGFRIDIAWPPLPAELESILISGGELAGLEARIRSIMDGHCNFAGFTNFNNLRTYPNLGFHNDMMHLNGYGWEQRYTVDMIKYLHGLLLPTLPLTPRSAAISAADAPEDSGSGRCLPNRMRPFPACRPGDK
jgi:hypothetical protein